MGNLRDKLIEIGRDEVEDYPTVSSFYAADEVDKVINEIEDMLGSIESDLDKAFNNVRDDLDQSLNSLKELTHDLY